MLRSALIPISVFAFGLVGCSSSEPPFQWGQEPGDAAAGDSAAGDAASPGDEDSGAAASDTSAPPPPPDVVDAPPVEEPWMPPSCNATPSRGANVPWQEYEAEMAMT